MAEYASIQGMQAGVPRVPVINTVMNQNNRVSEFAERLRRLNDRISGSQPSPVDGIKGSSPEPEPPLRLTLTRLDANIERCHSLLSDIENSIVG